MISLQITIELLMVIINPQKKGNLLTIVPKISLEFARHGFYFQGFNPSLPKKIRQNTNRYFACKRINYELN